MPLTHQALLVVVVSGGPLFSVTAASNLIIFRGLPINLGKLARFSSVWSCGSKSQI